METLALVGIIAGIVGAAVGVIGLLAAVARSLWSAYRSRGAPARGVRVIDPPPPPPEYVAREDDENRVAELVIAGEAVCVTGDPGIGKSSLAMQVARSQQLRDHFTDGVWWLDAAGLDLAAMCEGVASACDTRDVVQAKTEEDKLKALGSAIAGQKVLVVLDNCERPAGSHRFVHTAHGATLITSQHRPSGTSKMVQLGRLTDEQCLRILRHTARRELKPNEEAIALQIVTYLEGHPFAVALAGGQLQDQNTSAEDVLADLKRRPWQVLRGRKGRAVKRSLDGAYKRLKADEKSLFAVLGVFGGHSFDLAAVQAVQPSADEVRMDGLVGRSLVRWEDGRYALHPLVRQYARDRLGRRREPYRKMAEHYLAVARALGKGPSTFKDLEPEVGNALAAMDWCLEARQWEAAARLALALDDYVDYRGLWHERRRRLEQGRQAARHAGDWRLQRACLTNLGVVAGQQGDYREASRLFQGSLAISEGEGDAWGIAATKHDLGIVAHRQGRHQEARRLYEESLAIKKEVGDRLGMAFTKHQLGRLAQDEGDLEAARLLYQESLEVKEELGDRAGMSASKHQLGTIAVLTGKHKEARPLYEGSLAIAEELGLREGMAHCKHQLGGLAELEGDTPVARELYQEALGIFESLGSPDAETVRGNLQRLDSQERGAEDEE